MRCLRTTLAEQILFYAMILGALAFFLAGAGCAQARRTYSYAVSVAPDGTVTKSINVDILNSDVKVGQLEAVGADGTRLKINDLDAQERASVIMQTQAEALGKALDAALPLIPTP